jgi:pimeloyl-ACP methyl ester carboxylesterase
VYVVPVETFTLETGEVDLGVRVAGEGAAVLVVLNGGPGQSHDYCESAEVLASASMRVVTFDQRGTGETPHPEDNDYSMAAYVRDLDAIRVALDTDQVHLLGHSFGGLYAMAYVAEHPDRVESLQLYGSSPVRSDDIYEGEFEARIEAYEADGTFPEGYNQPPDDDCALYFQTIWPVYLHDPAFPMPALLEQTTCSIRTFTGFSRDNRGGWDLSDALGDYDGPVSVRWGESDPFREESASIAAYLESAEVEEEELTACGHYWEECAQAFFDGALAFASGQ